MSTRAHTAKAAVLAAVGAFVLGTAPAMGAARPSFGRYPIRGAGAAIPTRVMPAPPGTAIRIQAPAQGVASPAPDAASGRTYQDRMGPHPST